MQEPSPLSVLRRRNLPVEPHFQDPEEARLFLERHRWPGGAVVCPHCRSQQPHYRLKSRPGSATGGRAGLWKCSGCHRQFTVTLGTLFEGARLPLHLWLSAAYLFFSTRASCDARCLQQTLGVSLKTAQALYQRLVYARSERRGLQGNSSRFGRVIKALLRIAPDRKHPLAMERRLAALGDEP